jgi:hypothetical protein
MRRILPYCGKEEPMADSVAITYANEFTAVTQSQIAHWQVFLPPGERLPTLVGNCPTCNDECNIRIAAVVIQGGAPAAAEEAPPQEITRQIICNCIINHQQPAGVPGGCGRYWLGTLTLQDDGSYALKAEEDRGLLPMATALNEALASQNKRVQGAAEKWLGAVTAIYGLFSLTGIATAKDALLGLSSRSKGLIAVVLGLGLASAALALVQGYLAAYGWPRAVSVMKNEELQDWYRRHEDYAGVAANHLRNAVVFAFVSLAAVTIVMILVWFLPRQAK